VIYTGEGLSVLIPAGGAIRDDPWRARSFEWIVDRYMRLLPDADLCFGDSDQEPYNRSQARNDAFSVAEEDMLLVADADTVFSVEQIAIAVGLIGEGAPWIIPYRSDGGYYNLSQEATAFVLSNRPDASISEPPDESMWEHNAKLQREAQLRYGGKL
jgi:hypothetical protein